MSGSPFLPGPKETVLKLGHKSLCRQRAQLCLLTVAEAGPGDSSLTDTTFVSTEQSEGRGFLFLTREDLKEKSDSRKRR